MDAHGQEGRGLHQKAMEFMISAILMGLGISPLICSGVGWAGGVGGKMPRFPTQIAHHLSLEQCLSAEALTFRVWAVAWHSLGIDLVVLGGSGK